MPIIALPPPLPFPPSPKLQRSSTSTCCTPSQASQQPRPVPSPVQPPLNQASPPQQAPLTCRVAATPARCAPSQPSQRLLSDPQASQAPPSPGPSTVRCPSPAILQPRPHCATSQAPRQLSQRPLYASRASQDPTRPHLPCCSHCQGATSQASSPNYSLCLPHALCKPPSPSPPGIKRPSPAMLQPLPRGAASSASCF